MNFQVSRYLDKRYKSPSLTYPVTIRIYHNRKNDDVKTGIKLTEEDFKALHSPKVRPHLKEVLARITEVQQLVETYLESVRLYNIEELRAYVNDGGNVEPKVAAGAVSSKSQNVFDWFDLKIEMLDKANQLGSKESYQSTKNVYQRFLKASALEFTFFTVSKLKEIETEMTQNLGIAISTIGKHARNLRSIFKMALNDGVITTADYPFGRYKYIIPEVAKAKKSLSRGTLRELLLYRPQTYFEARAVAFFTFSYFANGMNLKDIALLRYKDWRGDVLYYYRKKTKNTNSTLKIIRVLVTDEMRQVIAEFGNKVVTPDAYIFLIVEQGMAEKVITAKVKTRNKSINKTLQLIVRKLRLDVKVTLGMSRHSFANALKQEGASISFIQEALGHGSPAVTEHYLNSFENAVSVEHIQKLRRYFELR
jgi:integrase